MQCVLISFVVHHCWRAWHWSRATQKQMYGEFRSVSLQPGLEVGKITGTGSRPFFLSPFSFFLCSFSFLEYEFLSHSLLPSPRPPAVTSRLRSCQPFPKVRTYAPLLFFHTITSKKTINPGYLLPYVSYFRLTHFTDSFVFHCVFISVCRID